MNFSLKFLIYFILLTLSFGAWGKKKQNFFPIIEVVKGQALWFSSENGQYAPVNPGLVISNTTRLIVSSQSHLVFSCPVGIAGRVSGPAEIILKPAENNR